MSAPAGETPRAGVRQTRHELGPAPPITSPTSAIHPPGGSPCAAPARFLDPPPVTRSRALSWTSAGSSMTLDASLTVTRPCSTASRPAGAAGLSSDSTLAAWATVLPLTRSSAAASLQVKELCKFAPFPFGGRPGADHAESLLGFGSMAALFSSRAPMEAAKPGSRSRSTKGFCGWSGPARSAPAVKPSAQPFSPPPRSTARSAHQPRWPNRLPASPPPIPDPRRCP